MSVDHQSGKKNPLEGRESPLFLSVRPGMTVVVQSDAPVGQKGSGDWWLGQVIWCEGGARDPKVNSMFQIADVDSGAVRWVNADLVTHVLPGENSRQL